MRDKDVRCSELYEQTVTDPIHLLYSFDLSLLTFLFKGVFLVSHSSYFQHETLRYDFDVIVYSDPHYHVRDSTTTCYGGFLQSSVFVHHLKLILKETIKPLSNNSWFLYYFYFTEVSIPNVNGYCIIDSNYNYKVV